MGVTDDGLVRQKVQREQIIYAAGMIVFLRRFRRNRRPYERFVLRIGGFYDGVYYEKILFPSAKVVRQKLLFHFMDTICITLYNAPSSSLPFALAV